MEPKKGVIGMKTIVTHPDKEGLIEHLKMRLVDYSIGDRSDWLSARDSLKEIMARLDDLGADYLTEKELIKSVYKKD